MKRRHNPRCLKPRQDKVRGGTGQEEVRGHFQSRVLSLEPLQCAVLVTLYWYLNMCTFMDIMQQYKKYKHYWREQILKLIYENRQDTNIPRAQCLQSASQKIYVHPQPMATWHGAARTGSTIPSLQPGLRKSVTKRKCITDKRMYCKRKGELS